MPYYINKNTNGILQVNSKFDGYAINIRWATSYNSQSNLKIAYHIYMDTTSPANPNDFFNQSPKFVSIDETTNADIIDLNPGQVYYFGVRAIEYDPNVFNYNLLPNAFNNLKVYPESLLRSNISEISSVIPLIDADLFPSSGTVKIGAELIKYTSVDSLNNNLVLSNVSTQRGYNNTIPTIHNTDGYDGYTYWSSSVLFWPVFIEEQNTKVYSNQNRFDNDHYAFNIIDGYRQKTKDILTTDLNVSEEYNKDFNSYSFSGWHRIHPLDILEGKCVGSYLGGEQFCADGYSGVGRMLRGIPLQERNLQRQEILLETVGEPCVLVRKVWTGIVCYCMRNNQEYPEQRCKKCYGTGYVVGYKQIFNFPRRADSRILVKFSPYTDDLKLTDNGLESDATINCWTLTVPVVKDRDFIVRFDQDDNEEFRYEVLNVERNILSSRLTGAQKFTVQRVRRTEPIYQVRVFRNTSDYPQTINTTTNGAVPAIIPHNHTFVINEKSISGMSQLTGISAGHNHTVVYQGGVLVVKEELGHTHDIFF